LLVFISSNNSHALGSVVNCIDSKSKHDYDWTICSRSRVVGCAAPLDVTFSEFRCLNADEQDPSYSTSEGIYQPRCGLENVLLTWTGPNYMYNLLKYNNIAIPDEGFSILRLFSLYDWHTNNHYDTFANDEDWDARPFVLDFYEIRKMAHRTRTEDHPKELSDDECENLWNTHYSHVLQKYEAGGFLAW
jgi:inositol oxygenase